MSGPNENRFASTSSSSRLGREETSERRSDSVSRLVTDEADEKEFTRVPKWFKKVHSGRDRDRFFVLILAGHGDEDAETEEDGTGLLSCRGGSSEN
mmetsp:Transcript_153/g.235  ORF Transcript_153/g.235 Transcript_153/m.235 type:complete len:96 (-) Transcript_153:250-537(-)